jgi:uncharacterized membrane protein
LEQYICPNIEPGVNKGFQVSKLLQYFLQGLLVIAPVAMTIYAVFSIVSFIDNQVPIFTARDPDGRMYVRNYGLGFLLVIAGIILLGYTSSFLFRTGFLIFLTVLKRTPGIRFIYSTTKEFFEAFAGEKKKFNKPVLANIDDNDVWRVGFITQEEAKRFWLYRLCGGLHPDVVFHCRQCVPAAPARVRQVTNINATDAMKFAISGGVTAVE